ncbi:28S ribosomal protein S18b, mitochondrial [Myiozetetes cayanensis]|uniref:28S ribosomal protein S18b, mitochondrial n=1 Tax=Myiozetetes cayanensis TaxID=478635 RepID=UPI002160D793|nr:28S ribosomal protein S18b, mitochondrial [Myiozetetes cayanensis]
MALGRAAAALRAALSAAGTPLWTRNHPRLCSSQEAPKAPEDPKAPKEPPSKYLERPWEYLESEEYRLTYGDRPVWFGYRRNHKGAIPPQRTRKACLRRGKPVGNPCPICRDRNLLVDFRNVKLLDQFICPHSGVVFHPTYTGVCMRQHKLLSKAIAQAQDHGLLWLQVPYVPTPREDFSNQHPAVGKTPPALRDPGGFWYSWYERWSPPPAEIARMRRLYRGFLKEEQPPLAPQSPAGEKQVE